MIMVGMMVTLFSEKMLIFHRRIRGLMPNLIKKSWTVSSQYPLINYPGTTSARFTETLDMTLTLSTII